MSALLEKALAAPASYDRGARPDDADIEALAIAWAQGRITAKQAAVALSGYCRRQNFSQIFGVALRRAAIAGRVRIEVVK